MKRSVTRWLAGGAAIVAALATVTAVKAARDEWHPARVASDLAGGLTGKGAGNEAAEVANKVATVVVDARDGKFRVAPTRPGANINKWYDNAQGLWRDGAPRAEATSRMRKAGLGVLRFPGGTSANLYRWRQGIGKVAKRGCQTDGDDLTGHSDNAYGVDEFMSLVDKAGAAPQIMVPFVNGSPTSAANLVEYLNAPVGSNPNGGVAWAKVRARHGHPAPYRVTRWEIGNEQDRRGHQRYWMSEDSNAALRQYIGGAERRFTDQAMGRDCDFTRGHTRSNGKPHQTFYLKYGLVKPNTSPVVKIGGDRWRAIRDLSKAGPRERVYKFNRHSGSVTFGDGKHGRAPADGAKVTVSYTFRHQGFAKMYDAMKRAAAATKTPIDVCATWAPISKRGTDRARLGRPSFPTAMKARGLASRYDCLSMHPYTNFGRDFKGAWSKPSEGHNQHMIGEAWMRKVENHHRADLKRNATAGKDGRRPYLTVSELGALWFGKSREGERSKKHFPNFSSTMTHSVYMASQFIHLARLRAGWVEGNTVVAGRKQLRGVLGGAGTGFVYGAEAATREAMKPAFARGSMWTGCKIEHQPYITVDRLGKWAALAAAATKGKDGKLRIVVVNRRMFKAQRAHVAPRGFAHRAKIDVTTVAGNSFASYNDGEPGGGDDSVRVVRRTSKVSGGDFRFRFPPHSITVLTLSPR